VNGLFEWCENEEEVEWLKEQIQGCVEISVDGRLELLSEGVK
jgi:hypothetical protein